MQEEFLEEEPRGEWTIENNQEQITDNSSEEWEDWEVTNPPEDMEAALRRAPPPRENEWTPTLKGTLRIRGNDPRKCRDEEPKEYKFHQPPPPPPSPTYSSPSNNFFCWNCKQNGHTLNDCWALSPVNRENNLCTWCEQIGYFLQECPQYLQNI